MNQTDECANLLVPEVAAEAAYADDLARARQHATKWGATSSAPHHPRTRDPSLTIGARRGAAAAWAMCAHESRLAWAVSEPWRAAAAAGRGWHGQPQPVLQPPCPSSVSTVPGSGSSRHLNAADDLRDGESSETDGEQEDWTPRARRERNRSPSAAQISTVSLPDQVADVLSRSNAATEAQLAAELAALASASSLEDAKAGLPPPRSWEATLLHRLWLTALELSLVHPQQAVHDTGDGWDDGCPEDLGASSDRNAMAWSPDEVTTADGAIAVASMSSNLPTTSACGFVGRPLAFFVWLSRSAGAVLPAIITRSRNGTVAAAAGTMPRHQSAACRAASIAAVLLSAEEEPVATTKAAVSALAAVSAARHAAVDAGIPSVMLGHEDVEVFTRNPAARQCRRLVGGTAFALALGPTILLPRPLPAFDPVPESSLTHLDLGLPPPSPSSRNAPIRHLGGQDAWLTDALLAALLLRTGHHLRSLSLSWGGGWDAAWASWVTEQETGGDGDGRLSGPSWILGAGQRRPPGPALGVSPSHWLEALGACICLESLRLRGLPRATGRSLAAGLSVAGSGRGLRRADLRWTVGATGAALRAAEGCAMAASGGPSPTPLGALLSPIPLRCLGVPLEGRGAPSHAGIGGNLHGLGACAGPSACDEFDDNDCADLNCPACAASARGHGPPLSTGRGGRAPSWTVGVPANEEPRAASGSGEAGAAAAASAARVWCGLVGSSAWPPLQSRSSKGRLGKTNDRTGKSEEPRSKKGDTVTWLSTEHTWAGGYLDELGWVDAGGDNNEAPAGTSSLPADDAEPVSDPISAAPQDPKNDAALPQGPGVPTLSGSPAHSDLELESPAHADRNVSIPPSPQQAQATSTDFVPMAPRPVPPSTAPLLPSAAPTFQTQSPTPANISVSLRAHGGSPNPGAWTREEDIALLDLWLANSGHWTPITAGLASRCPLKGLTGVTIRRTENACKNRFGHLHRAAGLARPQARTVDASPSNREGTLSLLRDLRGQEGGPSAGTHQRNREKVAAAPLAPPKGRFIRRKLDDDIVIVEGLAQSMAPTLELAPVDDGNEGSDPPARAPVDSGSLPTAADDPVIVPAANGSGVLDRDGRRRGPLDLDRRLTILLSLDGGRDVWGTWRLGAAAVNSSPAWQGAGWPDPLEEAADGSRNGVWAPLPSTGDGCSLPSRVERAALAAALLGPWEADVPENGDGSAAGLRAIRAGLDLLGNAARGMEAGMVVRVVGRSKPV